MTGKHEAVGEITQLRTTNEWLRAENARLRGPPFEAYEAIAAKRDELQAENERLRSLLAEWENHAGPFKDAEIERLTAVLHHISQLDDDGEAPGLARRALEPKP